MAQFDPVQVAFDSAIRDFKDKLQDDDLYRDIIQVKSIEEVYDATDKLQQEQGKKGHLRHLSKIAPYLTRINDYTNAVNAFIQVKPDILGLIWGPIVLLLQWASILKTSFDAIINAIEEISQALPEFERAARLFAQNTNIKDVLLLFFKDILEFYLVVFKFFRLPRWKYVFEALWPKHREKIKVVIQHLGSHGLLLRKEVQFEHIQQQHEATLRSLDHFEAAEKAHQLQEYNGIRIEISPQTYDYKLDWLRGRMCSGTGKWLLEHQTFTQWLNVSDVSMRLMWIQGIPGAGKTFLACTVVDEARKIPQSRTFFAFLSHNFSSSTSALSVLHSLIFQLTTNDDELQTILCRTSRENFKSNIGVALEIFSSLLICSGPVFIIIDGLDEIEKTERSRLVIHLMEIQAKCEQVRICFSSRSEDDLKTLLEKEAALLRVDNHNVDSIYEFVKQWSDKWFLERRIHPKEQSEMRKWLAPLPSRSHGMFLYTKVVLRSLEDMDGWDEIYNALTVLPETLDDAYARILSRINCLPHPASKEKARKLLGWIACSATPLTVREMQCGLKVKKDDREGHMQHFGDLQVERICGPIVEVVDDYVQFVHFTVKEYITSPKIDGYIDVPDSTLSLAMSCITFLCQNHHDPQLQEAEIHENILDGTYILHEYAATNWLGLVERCVSLGRTGTAPPDLIPLLNEICICRTNPDYIAETGELKKFTMNTLKETQPELFQLLSKVASFRDLCLNTPHRSAEVIALDPLTITQTSVLIENATNDSFCRNQSTHADTCYCDQIRECHGGRPFRCRFSYCHFRRQGFAHRSDLNTHERYHERPWKCDISTCEYANGGFLSRKMRDEHFAMSHQAKTSSTALQLSKTNPRDLKLILIDLILNADVDTVESVKSGAKKADIAGLPELSMEVIFREIAARGSLYQLRLLKELYYPNINHLRAGINSALKAKNEECFEALLNSFVKAETPSPHRLSLLSEFFHEVLSSDSIEAYSIYEKYAREDIDARIAEGKSKERIVSLFIRKKVLSTTTGNPQREQLLLNFINENNIIEAVSKRGLGGALTHVAQSCCSVRLATCLIEAGADVDHRFSDIYLTPLHHAARNTSAEAAELMKFLLLRGADPQKLSARSKLQIRDEKGAKGISKWFGVSWDELVEQTKKEREDMQAKQVSSSY